MSNQNLERHREYYIPSGDLYLQVGNVLFRVHSYFFDRDSSKFREILREPLPPDVVRLGSTDTDPLPIKSKSPRDFANFLWVFYNPLYSVYDASSADWIGILKIACEYEFTQVRNLAVRHLDLSGLSAVERLRLYLLYRVEAIHVVPLYASLCMRDSGPTDAEADELGTKTVLLIWRMREQLRAQSTGLILDEELAIQTVCLFLKVDRTKLNTGGSRRRRVPVDPLALALARSASDSKSFPRPMTRSDLDTRSRNAYVYGNYFSSGPGPESENAGTEAVEFIQKVPGEFEVGQEEALVQEYTGLSKKLLFLLFVAAQEPEEIAMEGSSRRSTAHGSAAVKSPKISLKDIAATTLKALEDGSFELDGTLYDLKEPVEYAVKNTILFRPGSELSDWFSNAPTIDNAGSASSLSEILITVHECSTLVGARRLKERLISSNAENQRVGVLNFASAKNPGGGFMRGAQAQEESIARSSTIYPALMSKVAQPFFQSHRKDPKEGYYSHAMLYIPRVLFFRSDKGDWLPPVEVEIVSSAAVNAGVVRRYLRERKSTDESELDAAMKERMARILYLFEKNGVRNLVLGSFGTGVFKNRVELVAQIWKELLVGPNARFGRSFDHVVFAVLGHSTFQVFEETFSKKVAREKL